MDLSVELIASAMKILVVADANVTIRNESSYNVVEKLETVLTNFEKFVVDNAHLRAAMVAKENLYNIFTSEALYWRFTAASLCLLCTLAELLSSDVPVPSSIPPSPSPSHNPPPPKHILGVRDSRLMQCLLQRVVYIGMYPYLSPAVDWVTKLRLCHLQGAMKPMLHADQQDWYLFKCCQMLLQCTKDSTLGPLILSNHFTDLLVALMQVCYSLQRGGTSVMTAGPEMVDVVTEEDRCWCQEALGNLLDRVHQPLVVRELLLIQGKLRGGKLRSEPTQSVDTRWLQRACGELLSECLMKPNGVQSVLRGIFDVMAGSGARGNSSEDIAQDRKRCRSIAQIIAACPLQASSVSSYYSQVCPQVLELLHVRQEKTAGQMARVAVAIFEAMASRNPAMAKQYLLDHLLHPLDCLASAESIHCDLIALAQKVEMCICDLNRICSLLEVTSPLVPFLIPYVPALFELSRLSCDQDGKALSTSQSAATCSLCSLLSSVDVTGAVELVLAVLLHCKGHQDGLKHVDPVWKIVYLDGCHLMLTTSASPSSQVELQDIDRMESMTIHITSLLQSELKSTRMIGELSLACFVHIKNVLHQIVYDSGTRYRSTRLSVSHKKSGGFSSELLDLEHQCERTDTGGSVAVLFLLAALCENMTLEVLEQADIHQLLDVGLHMITVHADFMSIGCSSSSTGLLNVCPDMDSLPGGSITLTMVFGMISSVLGGARKVSKADRTILSQLLQPLETISSRYPDPELRIQANELRICVATLGAVWSAEVGQKAGDDLIEKLRTTAVADQTKKKGTQLIEELYSGDSMANIRSIDAGKSTGHDPTSPGASQSASHGPGHDPTSPGASQSASHGPGHDLTSPSAFQAALKDLQDPLLPVRAHGLVALAKQVESKDADALSRSSSLLVIFKENLAHQESFVYLAAINGITSLASAMPQDVIPILCQEYAHSTRINDPRMGMGTSHFNTAQGEKYQHVLKLGEALVKAARNMGELLPHYSDTLLSALMTNVKNGDTSIRTSALSNLAEVCGLLHWSFSRVHHEVLDCVTHVLHSDREPTAQRAALLVIKLLIRGLSQDTIQVLGSSLRDLYRLVKQVEAIDSDDLTIEHAQAVLGELDTVMRTYLFPRETLTKKISILDPPI